MSVELVFVIIAAGMLAVSVVLNVFASRAALDAAKLILEIELDKHARERDRIKARYDAGPK